MVRSTLRPLVGGLIVALLAVPMLLRPVAVRAVMVGQAVIPGRALAWGYIPGTGTAGRNPLPVPVSGLGSGVVAIAGGGSHTLALRSDGSVMAWGDNSYGELGNGTVATSGCYCSDVPVAVSGLNGVIAIAGGGSHSLALKSDGSVVAWGYNHNGELGDGSVATSGCDCTATPVAVSGLSSGVVAIAGGGGHSLALKLDGSVVAWGGNFNGQLGDGSVATSGCYCRATPAAVSGLTSGVIAIAGGGSHSLALKSDGSVVAWGDDTSGELGDGTVTTSGCYCKATPVAVSGLSSGVTALAGGGSHSLALKLDGSVVAWGENAEGQLGDGTTPTGPGCDCATRPAAVKGIGSGVIAIAAGGYSSLAIQLAPRAALPAMSNGAYGGYVTTATIQNTGAEPADMRIAYFDQTGTPVGTGDTIHDLQPNAAWTVRQDNGHSFPGGGGDAVQAGSAVVYSNQPIAAFVNEFAPGNAGDATGYSGITLPSGLGTTLYAPTIVNDAYGDYTTGIGVLNLGVNSTDVTITYRDGAGTAVMTQLIGVAVNAYQALYSGDTGLGLPAGFAGTATITSQAGQLLAAVVNETGPGGQLSSYGAVPIGAMLLKAPVTMNNALDGYFTGIGMQNTSPTAGGVSIIYYDSTGAVAGGSSFSIPANGSLGVYQGGAAGPAVAGTYAALIQSDVPVAAVVNEVAPPGAGAARRSTSYNTFPTGSGVLHLPLVENGGSDPWNTGEGIMNTGAGSTVVTVTYHDAATGTVVGTASTTTLAPNAFLGIYQPNRNSGLPAGLRATAVVTAGAGGQVAAITNESSATMLMSYNAQ